MLCLESATIFTEKMEEEIKDLLAESDFESKFVNQWVEEIVDTAQKKLKDMKKPKFCFAQFRIENKIKKQ